MKKLMTISAIVMSGLVYNTANAQIRIGIGIHLFPHRIFVPRPEVIVQTQVPVYQEPVVSDNDDCDFYYLPDVGAYYSVTEQCYYYQDGDNWVSAAYLPGVYRDYDWRYAARRYEIHEARPYLHNDVYRSRYQGFDRDLARNHDHFAAGFNYNAYNNGQRFDNRGGNNGQHFDNRNQNNFGQQNAWNQRDNNRTQQFNQNNGRDNNKQQANQDQNRGGWGNNNNQHANNQQRLAQNNNRYNGHNNGERERF